MKIKIGKEFTPSTAVKQEVIEVSKIIVTAGGGMGGSLWQIYTKDKFDLNQKFIEINSNLSKNHFISTDYIVQVHPVKIAHVELLNNGNSNIGGGPGNSVHYYYECQMDDEVIFSDGYNGFSDSKLNNIINKDFI